MLHVIVGSEPSSSIPPTGHGGTGLYAILLLWSDRQGPQQTQQAIQSIRFTSDPAPRLAPSAPSPPIPTAPDFAPSPTVSVKTTCRSNATIGPPRGPPPPRLRRSKVGDTAARTISAWTTSLVARRRKTRHAPAAHFGRTVYSPMGMDSVDSSMSPPWSPACPAAPPPARPPARLRMTHLSQFASSVSG